MVFLTGCIIGAGFFLYVTQTNHKYIDTKTPVFTYATKATVNYGVLLIPNQIYPVRRLGENGMYITWLVDYIDTVFKFQFNSENRGEVKGTYSIAAVVDGSMMSETGKKNVVRKEFVIVPKTNFGGKDKSVVIQKQAPVKIKEFNNYVTQMNNYLGVNMNNTVTIKWNILIKVKTKEGEKEEKLTPTMEIPLNTKFFEIQGKLAEEKKGAIEVSKKVVSPGYYNKIMLGIFIEGTSAILIISLIFFTSPLIISPHQKQLNKILKYHGSRMVAVKSEIISEANNYVEISTVDDLVKIADDIARPILYQGSSNPEEISQFYVLDVENVYYVDIEKELRNSDTEA